MSTRQFSDRPDSYGSLTPLSAAGKLWVDCEPLAKGTQPSHIVGFGFYCTNLIDKLAFTLLLWKTTRDKILAANINVFSARELSPPRDYPSKRARLGQN